MLESDLQDGMRARRLRVGCVLRGDSEVAAVLDHIQELICAADQFFLHADYINILLLILSDLELCPRVQQVV